MELQIAGVVAALAVTALALWIVRRGHETEPAEPWSAADVDAYLESSELYDVDQLKEIGAYDVLLGVAEAGEVTDEEAFERLCDAVVAAGADWEDAVEEFADGDLDDISRSWQAHQDAREREPPVDIGEEVRLGVLELETHHSGDRRAVGKVEGFVVFVQDVPKHVSEGDILRAKVMYFNRRKTSASASLLEVLE
ncbi:hypothetical protein [Natronosalvus vescus]|uniref:hypothetical protein n=1 Tax=Natronosalvus vescus TaxID=2953881 RepID=UPI002090D12B|nr:hypothetical protein [Natronosalvus vescus]